LVELFERVINLIHTHAPQAAIAFNTTGENSVTLCCGGCPIRPS